MADALVFTVSRRRAYATHALNAIVCAIVIAAQPEHGYMRTALRRRTAQIPHSPRATWVTPCAFGVFPIALAAWRWCVNLRMDQAARWVIVEYAISPIAPMFLVCLSCDVPALLTYGILVVAMRTWKRRSHILYFVGMDVGDLVHQDALIARMQVPSFILFMGTWAPVTGHGVFNILCRYYRVRMEPFAAVGVALLSLVTATAVVLELVLNDSTSTAWCWLAGTSALVKVVVASVYISIVSQ